VTIDPVDGAVVVRRFASRGAAVAAMLEAQSASAAAVDTPAPAGPLGEQDPEGPEAA
jgi:hypothetical protein